MYIYIIIVKINVYSYKAWLSGIVFGAID